MYTSEEVFDCTTVNQHFQAFINTSSTPYQHTFEGCVRVLFAITHLLLNISSLGCDKVVINDFRKIPREKTSCKNPKENIWSSSQRFITDFRKPLYTKGLPAPVVYRS